MIEAETLAALPCPLPARSRARGASPRLGLAELTAFIGDRDEAFRLLRRLRIPACDPARPVRVPLDRVLRRMAHIPRQDVKNPMNAAFYRCMGNTMGNTDSRRSEK